MLTSKARWTKAAAKLALTMAISAFSMATTPAAAVDPISAARAAALRDCSWMSDDAPVIAAIPSRYVER
jgi:hypothetical protein